VTLCSNTKVATTIHTVELTPELLTPVGNVKNNHTFELIGNNFVSTVFKITTKLDPGLQPYEATIRANNEENMAIVDMTKVARKLATVGHKLEQEKSRKQTMVQ